MTDLLVIVVQAVVGVGAPEGTFDVLIVRGAIWILGLGGAAAVWLIKLNLAQNKKLDTFFVSWYGDPSDKMPNGAKSTLYATAKVVTELREWSRGYDLALSALSRDNEELRRVWQPGDPERRRLPRGPNAEHGRGAE